MKQGRLAARVGYLGAHVPHMLIGAAVILGFPYLVPAHEYGHFAVGFAFVNIAGALFYGWLQLSLVRLAGGTDDARPPRISTIVSCLMVPVIPCAFVAWTLAAMGVLDGWFPAALATAGFSAATSVGQLSRGLHRPRVYAIVGVARLVFVFGAAIGLTHYWKTQDSLLYAIACGSFLAAIVGLVGSTHALGTALTEHTGPARRIDLRGLLAYGLPASLSLIAMMIMLHGDRFVLGVLYDPSVVAAFSAQSGTARQIIYPAISALAISVVPNALLVRTRDGNAPAVRNITREGDQVLMLMAPVLAIAMVFGDSIASMVLPAAYRPGADIIVPLSSISAYAMGCRLVRYDPVFHVMLRPRYIAFCALVAVSCWALMLYPAARWLGPAGAAIVGLMATFVANTVAGCLIRSLRLSERVFPWSPFVVLIGLTSIALGVRLGMDGQLAAGISIGSLGVVVLLRKIRIRRQFDAAIR